MGPQPALPGTFLDTRAEERLRKASQPFLGKWKRQYFSLLIACDPEHVVCAFDGGLEKEEQERNSLKPFLLVLLLAFGASLGIALLTEEYGSEEKEGDVFSRRLFTSALF